MKLENAVQSAKTRREWSVEYMTLYEKMKMERDEGRTEGSNERAREMAVKMIRANEPDEKIIEYTGLNASEVSEIREGLPVR